MIRLSFASLLATAACASPPDGGAPPVLAATAGLHHIELRWTGGAASGYHVFRSSDGAVFDRLTASAITMGSYDDPIASPAGDGVRYHYRIATDDASEPSNTVSAVQGTRLAAAYPDGFTTSPEASPYMLDGTTTLGGDLWVTPGTKLYVAAGGAIEFAGAGHRLLIDGLLQATGTAAAPVRLAARPASGYFADGEGFQIVFAGDAYQPADGSGSRIDHAEITNLAEASGDDRQRPLTITGSGIAFDHVKLSVNRDSPLFGRGGIELDQGGWVILRHCWLEGLGLSLASDLSTTPFSVTGNVFRGGEFAFELDHVEATAIRAGQIDQNDLDGTLFGTMSHVTGSAAVPLGGNYWAGAPNGGGVPFTYVDETTSATFGFSDPSAPLIDPPPGVGPDW